MARARRREAYVRGRMSFLLRLLCIAARERRGRRLRERDARSWAHGPGMAARPPSPPRPSLVSTVPVRLCGDGWAGLGHRRWVHSSSRCAKPSLAPSMCSISDRTVRGPGFLEQRSHLLSRRRPSRLIRKAQERGPASEATRYPLRAWRPSSASSQAPTRLRCATVIARARRCPH